MYTLYDVIAIAERAEPPQLSRSVSHGLPSAFRVYRCFSERILLGFDGFSSDID